MAAPRRSVNPTIGSAEHRADPVSVWIARSAGPAVPSCTPTLQTSQRPQVKSNAPAEDWIVRRAL